ncbi:MAG: hypothetical protein IRY95_07755 [Clostridia bacterium]|nr:hypothetical protein [Clostridia bacterium]
MAAAVADGVVTVDELDGLREAQRRLGLTDADLQAIRGEVIRQALRAATEDKRLSPEEEQSLRQLAEHFGLPPDRIPANRAQLERYRLLYRLEREPLPVVTVPGLVLRRGETPHWAEPGELLEERVINRRYEGGSSGFSIRIAKGVRHQVVPAGPDQKHGDNCRHSVGSSLERKRPCRTAAPRFSVAARERWSSMRMYHTIRLTARVGALAADPDLSDRVLTELERLERAGRIAAPVVSQDMVDGTLGATFCIDGLPSALDALARARDAFAEALAVATNHAVTDPVYAEIQVIEEREEAAALA